MSIQDEIPRSRINLRYRTEINGAAQMLELPFRVMILADLSCGSSVDREVDVDTRKLRSLDDKNIDSVMENMRMSVNFRVKNCIDSESEDQLEVQLPIRNRKSLNPEQVASNIPKVRSLLLLRKLILELQANVDNRKDLRRLIQEIWSHPDKLQALKRELEPLADYRLAQQSKALTQPSTP